MTDPQKLGLGFPKLNDPTQIINRNFPIWPQPPAMLHPSSDDAALFQVPRPANPNRNRSMNWNNKKAIDRRNRAANSAAGELSGYQPQSLNDLQFQNRVKTRRFYPKKNKFVNRFAPYAPRNTTSFIIRAKKSGGIASLISPCPVTPAILPTPKFSPSREGLVDMAKEEWGVDGYGSMKGLIRLRSGNRLENLGEEEEEDEEEGSTGSDSDVEEHLEVEKRLDHDLSRFEMVYPSFGEDQGAAAAYILENKVDDQDASIAKLEEENLTLKERMFLMEREMSELRMRLERLENINMNNDNGNNNNIVGSINVDEHEHEPSYSDNNVNLNGNEEMSEGDCVCSEEKNVDCVCSEEKNVDCDGVESNENSTREE